MNVAMNLLLFMIGLMMELPHVGRQKVNMLLLLVMSVLGRKDLYRVLQNEVRRSTLYRVLRTGPLVLRNVAAVTARMPLKLLPMHLGPPT